MNVEIRAKRILAALSNFQVAAEIDSRPPDVPEYFGSFIGRYCNLGNDAEILWFYENAVLLSSPSGPIEIQFQEIGKVILPDQKESEGLVLVMRDGRNISLPVRGVHGRFFDSLEVVRFFDRVLADLR